MAEAGATSRSGAHVAWERSWREASTANRWTVPETDVRDIVPVLRARSVRRVLDVGCGLGRHSHLFAEEGFQVVGLDASVSGLHRSVRVAKPAGDAEFLLADMISLPFADNSFDYVLAWNVVYHGIEPDVAAAIQEIRRVLCPRGLYQATMLSKRHARYGVGVEVDHNAFVRPGEDSDKQYPHYYCGAAELLALHQGFEVLSLRDVDHRPEHATRSGSFHWHSVFERVR